MQLGASIVIHCAIFRPLYIQFTEIRTSETRGALYDDVTLTMLCFDLRGEWKKISATERRQLHVCLARYPRQSLTLLLCRRDAVVSRRKRCSERGPSTHTHAYGTLNSYRLSISYASPSGRGCILRNSPFERPFFSARSGRGIQKAASARIRADDFLEGLVSWSSPRALF